MADDDLRSGDAADFEQWEAQFSAGTTPTPDGFVPIIAWRAWVLTPEGLLGSVPSMPNRTSFAIWRPGEVLVARCIHLERNRKPPTRWYDVVHPAGEPIPAKNCSCGLYGMKDSTNPVAPVVGQVQLWGHIIEHEAGYRAQFGKVHALESLELAEKYGVPTIEPRRVV